MTDEPPEILTVKSAYDLLQVVDLKALRTFEISGLRVDAREDVDPETQTLGIEVNEQHDPSMIETRFRATVRAPEADFSVQVGLLYQTTEPVEVPPSVMKEFLEKVAVMAAYPFVREAIATTAARMELPVPVLGLLRQGDIELTVNGDSGQES